MGIGAKNKGYMKNKSTGEVKKFMFNPNTIADSRSITFSEISSPGSSYPKFQYVNTGARTFSLEVFLYNSKQGVVEDYLKFIDKFLPSGKSFSKPPILVLAMGSDVRECIVGKIDRVLTEYDSNLRPTQATVTLDLIQLG